MIEIKFTPSTDGLIKALQALEKDLQVKALRSGIVAAIKPVKPAMAALAPRKTGKLSESIGHIGLSASAAGRVGAGGLAIIVGSVKRSGGRSQYAKAVWHDLGTIRMKATPFIEKGFKQVESGFDARFYKGLSKYLKRVGFA